MIRPYHPSDQQTLVEILKLNVPKYFDQKEVAEFEEYLKEHAITYLTIEHEKKIVGGTGYLLTDNNTIGHVRWIFFHPDSAGHGLGSEAMKYCLAKFQSVPTVKKLIVTTSQLVYKFFEKFGLVLIKTEKNYWGKGLDLYWMEMEFNSH
jgi:N-acetylglutamate synthase-like GNAT family acetyltransferase